MQLPTNLTEVNDLLLKLPQEKIAKACTALLLCYLAYLFAQFTWVLLPKKQTNSLSLPTYIGQSGNVNNHQTDVSALQALNLFGVFNEQVKVATVKVQDAPETKLRLTLSGAVASDDPSIAVAVIENNGKQETYGIGDKIIGTRAVLNRVFRDRVLIKQSGRLETLMLDGFKYSKQEQDRATKAPRKVVNQVNNRSKQQQVDGPNVVDQRNNKALSESAAQLKADINQNPGKITDYLRISPKRQAGKVVGYRLMPGKKAQFFQSSGLKTGDIAVQMNGLDLTQPREAAQALKALKEAQELSLLIDRNGEMIEILFGIN